MTNTRFHQLRGAQGRRQGLRSGRARRVCLGWCLAASVLASAPGLAQGQVGRAGGASEVAPVNQAAAAPVAASAGSPDAAGAASTAPAPAAGWRLPTPAELGLAVPRPIKAATALMGMGRQRLALVVGNGRLGGRLVLDSAYRDSQAVAAALRAGGFLVMAREDLTARDLRASLLDFRSRLQPGGIGLIYVAALGVQLDGQNLLLPRELELPAGPAAEGAGRLSAQDLSALLKASAVPVAELVDALASTPDSPRLLVVDGAYRHPVLGGLPAPGLTEQRLPPGLMALFGHALDQVQEVPAVAPWDEAAPGDPRELAASAFGRVLVAAMLSDGMTPPEVLRRTRSALFDASDGRVAPWLGGDTSSDEALAEESITALLPRTPEELAREAMRRVLGELFRSKGSGGAALLQPASVATLPVELGADGLPVRNAASTASLGGGEPGRPQAQVDADRAGNARPADAPSAPSSASTASTASTSVSSAGSLVSALGTAATVVAGVKATEALLAAQATAVATTAATSAATGLVSTGSSLLSNAVALGVRNGVSAGEPAARITAQAAAPLATPAAAAAAAVTAETVALAATASPATAAALAATAPSATAVAAPATVLPPTAGAAAAAATGTGTAPPAAVATAAPIAAAPATAVATAAASGRAPEAPSSPLNSAAPVLPPPKINPYGYGEGDAFLYQITDQMSEQVTGTFMHAIDQVAADGSLVGNGRLLQLDPQGRLQSTQRPDGTQAHFDPYQDLWQASPVPGQVRNVRFTESFQRPDGSRGVIDWQGVNEVGRAEKLRTAAGEFDVLPIQTQGRFVENVRAAQGQVSTNGRWRRTVWYSPALGHPVAIDIHDLDLNGRVFRRQRIELVHAQRQRSQP